MGRLWTALGMYTTKISLFCVKAENFSETKFQFPVRNRHWNGKFRKSSVSEKFVPSSNIRHVLNTHRMCQVSIWGFFYCDLPILLCSFVSLLRVGYSHKNNWTRKDAETVTSPSSERRRIEKTLAKTAVLFQIIIRRPKPLVSLRSEFIRFRKWYDITQWESLIWSTLHN